MVVFCWNCGKRFDAPESLTGKRVKCRACGEIFAVVQNTEEPADAPDLTQDAFDVPAPPPTRQITGARAGRPLPQAQGSAFDINDDGFDADDSNLHAPRRNTLPAYAGAEVIDRFLPILLVLLSVGWTCAEAMNGNEIGPMWISALRLGLFWLLYAAVVWPLVRLGGLKGNDLANVEPPANNTWRVFAAFAFPTALAYILWTINGGLGTLISGLAVGVAIGLAVHFVLQRLTPNEGIKVLPVVGGWYVGAVVACTLFFVGVNFATQTVMTASRTAHLYKSSPLGQYMPWSPPPPPVDARDLALRSLPPTNPNSRPTVRGAQPDAQGTSQSGATPSIDPEQTPRVQPGIATPTNTQGNNATDVTPVLPTQPSATATPGDATSGIAATTSESQPRDSLFGNASEADPMAELNAAVDAGTRPAVGGPVPQVKSPLVASVEPVTDMGVFNRARFPLLPSRHGVIIYQAGMDRDDLEIWDLTDMKKVSEVTFRRDAGLDPGYAMSHTGKTLVRLSNFPSLSMHVWSVDEQRVARAIPLAKNLGTPYTVGFSEDNVVWILWELGDRYGLQSWDTSTGQRLRQVELVDYVPGSNNFAISSDGKTAAFLRTNRNEQGELSILNLKTGVITRRLLLAGMDRNPLAKPTGVAFSDDGTKVALVLEHNEQGVMFVWNVADPKPTGQYILPDRQALAAGFRGRPANQLQWLPDGVNVLFGGNTLIDATTGRVHGNLEIGDPSAQRLIDAKTLLVALPNPKAETQFIPNRGQAEMPMEMHRVMLKVPAKAR